MAKKPSSSNSHKAICPTSLPPVSPRTPGFWHGDQRLMPLQLDEPVRLEMTEQLNQLLADTMTLRDLYKKSHWQVVGSHFLSTPPSVR